ncbi:ATP-binding protein [Pseudoalteromonas sp.]|uniref:ATP-binding protein n=1 Tax=Pseudoalteromonas sp. TaxID=53249 RepID=UPI00272C9739|nr:ATP-binding protein [Pseudoalteromonas sp.]
MIRELIEGKLLESPWPVWVDNKLVSGTKVGIANQCDKSCRNHEKVGISCCNHNLTQITKKIDGQYITICDVYIQQSCITKKRSRNLKLKEQKASLESIHSWFEQIDKKISALKNIVEVQSKKRFDPFHEFVKWANEIEFYSKKLISKDGFEKSSSNLKSLYKTSVMLQDSLDTAALYVNPESASFGRKRDTDIYSMIHKISAVLSHSKSTKSGVKITFMGRVENRHRVYESFKVIPLTLLQNAIKYKKCNDIEVVFDEKGDRLDLSVVSYGDLLKPDELNRIFERGYRTSAAKKMNVEGSGLGLYALKVVADAHGFNVKVRSELLDSDQFNRAKNIFTVSIF